MQSLNLGAYVRGPKRGVFIGLVGAMAFAAYVLVNRYVYVHYDVDAFNYSVTVLLASGFWGLLSLLVRRRRESYRVFSKDIWSVVGLALAGGLGVGLIVLGQSYTTAVNASLVITSGILTTALFSRLFLKESFSHWQMLWVGVMFVGLYLGIVGTHLIDFKIGDFIIFGSEVILGYAGVLSKMLMDRYSSHFLADTRLFLGGILFLIIGLVLSGSDVLVVSAGLWPLLSGLCFWLALKLFYMAVKLLNPNIAIVLGNSQLVFASIAGVWLLNEPYGLTKFIGSAIVLASIYFISKK